MRAAVMCHTQVNISKLRGVFALSGNLPLKKEAKGIYLGSRVLEKASVINNIAP